MYRHDFILRLIERLGSALVALRNRILRRKSDETAIRAEIGEIAKQAGLDLGLARSLDPDMLLMWLAPTGQSDPAKLWLMAELLYLEGLQSKVSESGEWRGDLERALAVLAAVPPEWRPGDALTDAGARTTEIRGLLEAAN